MNREEAFELLWTMYKPPFSSNDLDKYSEEVVYPNTGGPFAEPGMVYGQAISIFEIETFWYRNWAVAVCEGKVIDITDEYDHELEPGSRQRNAY